MYEKMPRTPFSTPLSGSAKETELRLKNIFSGPKKRPPALFLALIFSVCIFCGNLVSCNVAQAGEPGASGSEAGSPDSSASIAVDSGDSVTSSSRNEGWLPVELENHIAPECAFDGPSNFLTGSQAALLENLPAEELPREAVTPYYAQRQDYWHDMLLPAAHDQAADVTVYFVVAPDSMPDMEPRACPDLFSLDQDGIVLRAGNQAKYFPLSWYVNAKFGSAPMLAVDDFDGDSRPEAALSLAWGEGSGCYAEALYIFDLDTMTCTTPDYSEIPLEITVRPDGTAAEVTGGDKTLPEDLTRLGIPFPGRVEVGNQVKFSCEDGRIFCRLALDFGCNTLGYLSSAEFPIVYEDGRYRLGSAAVLRDIL